MSEWKDIKDAPKDGTLILIVLPKENEITFQKHFLVQWVEGKGWYDSARLIWWENDSHILGWMPLPEPPKKKHQCKKGLFTCETDPKKPGLVIIDCHGHWIECSICPFCGEKE